MLRLLVFTCAALLFVIAEPEQKINEEHNVIYNVRAKDNSSVCTNHEAKMWSYGFHNCFFDRKYTDGGTDLNNIVDRILEHSGDCIKNSTKQCRPDQAGFLVIMEKVIQQIKDYCNMYLEYITHDRHKVKDLECVESILSLETYKNCFKTILDQGYPTEVLQREVEKAISCTNESHEKCSKIAKTSLNRMVRNIIGVKQPTNENIEDDPQPEEPKPWYERYITEPLKKVWKAIKSFFGF